MRMHALMPSALAALTLPISLAALGGGYLACYMEYTGKASASCYIPSINATYGCALTAGAPLCFTRQEEELPCLYVLNRPGELPEVSCMVAIPRAATGKTLHVVIDDARFGGPGTVVVRTVRTLEAAPMRRPTGRMTDEPARTIPTIGELMRPPPPPPVTQQDIEDALEAAATGAAAAETAAAAANAAAQAAQAAQQSTQQQELRCRPDYIGGVVCRPR